MSALLRSRITILHFIRRRNVKVVDKNKILQKNDVAFQNILGMFETWNCVFGGSYKTQNYIAASVNFILKV